MGAVRDRVVRNRLIVAAVLMMLAPVPLLPHLLAPGSIETAERLEPGSRQFVHAQFGLFKGESLEGKVTVTAGAAVVMYVMDTSQFEGLSVAGFTEYLAAAQGAVVNFSFVAPAAGTYHLVIGHSAGNESGTSALEVRARVAVNPLAFALALGLEGAGAVMFIVGVRTRALTTLARQDAQRLRSKKERKSWK